MPHWIPSMVAFGMWRQMTGCSPWLLSSLLSWLETFVTKLQLKRVATIRKVGDN
ncbi:unnamed protein product, partial [Larinioides sclopetarius]